MNGPLGSLLISWLVLAVVMWLTAAIVPGVNVRGAKGAIIVAALFGLLNACVGWLLFVAIGIGTLGLGFLLAFITRWVVNAILLKLVDAISDNLSVASFGRALLAALVMAALSAGADLLLRQI